MRLYCHPEAADVKVGQTFQSACLDVAENDWPADRRNYRPENATSETRPPRIWVGEGFRFASSREDGRFFAALRMTCLAIVISEMFR